MAELARPCQEYSTAYPRDQRRLVKIQSTSRLCCTLQTLSTPEVRPLKDLPGHSAARRYTLATTTSFRPASKTFTTILVSQATAELGSQYCPKSPEFSALERLPIYSPWHKRRTTTSALYGGGLTVEVSRGQSSSRIAVAQLSFHWPTYLSETGFRPSLRGSRDHFGPPFCTALLSGKTEHGGVCPRKFRYSRAMSWLGGLQMDGYHVVSCRDPIRDDSGSLYDRHHALLISSVLAAHLRA